MVVPKLRERRLGERSQVQVRYWTGPASRHPHLDILVLRYAGVYPAGSAGNEDAQFMYAMAQAGVAMFEPWGVIHDCSGLLYDWGDRLEGVLAVGPRADEPGAALVGAIFGSTSPAIARQPAVVVGPDSEEAVRTLLLGEQSDDSIESLDYVFRDLQSAWAFVDSQIT